MNTVWRYDIKIQAQIKSDRELNEKELEQLAWDIIVDGTDDGDEPIMVIHNESTPANVRIEVGNGPHADWKFVSEGMT